MDLYNKKINEFTDWVHGTNSLTGGNDTENLPVSGERIRELLQERLQKPVYLNRDTTENLYRIFSSVEAWKLWDSDRSTYSKLELASFAAPSLYTVKVEVPIGGTLLYAREGVHDENTIVSFSWEVVDGQNNTHDENMYIDYFIEESGATRNTTKTPDEKAVSEDLYDLLVPGRNTVKISFRGSETGAIGNKEVVIIVLKLDISTDLDYTSVQKNLHILDFSLYANRNIEGPLSFKTCRYYYGSGEFNKDCQETYNEDFNIFEGDENNYTPSRRYLETASNNVSQLKAGLHSLLVYANMNVNNRNFNSNLLYYIFGIGYPAGGEQIYHGISAACSFNNKINFIGSTEFMLSATQYEEFTLNWGYINYIGGAAANISWYIRSESTSNPENVTDTLINTFNLCISNTAATPLKYIPMSYTVAGINNYLVAKINELELIKLPIYITKSKLTISETTGAELKLKLSAYGRQNSSEGADTWTYSDYSTTFTEVKWNDASGWYDNSLRLSGQQSSAVINFNPFDNVDAENKGVTIEIEFESEYIQSTEEELIRLGSLIPSEPHISIYANKASLYIQNRPIITTNYKLNERVKLAFIVEPSNPGENYPLIDDWLKSVIFIVNNGIAERAAGWKDYLPQAFSASSGNITIGGCLSGIRVYSIRCYTAALTIKNAYDNYLFDSSDKSNIFYKNDIYRNGLIDKTKCEEKIDVIILKGPLNKVLARDTKKGESNTECDFLRISYSDRSKNFEVTHGRIRKHGQSTLNYPLTSYKLWTWSSVDDVRPTLRIAESELIPFSKNRYQMKDDSIPANKFVLQANYADSSGTHNGGFLRLINDIWYKCKIDGEYKLRTQPQLFTTNQTISPQVWEENGQIVGDTDLYVQNSNLFLGAAKLTPLGKLFSGRNADGKQWGDYFGEAPFPHKIRIAPDSFPCLVFYLNDDTGDTVPSFLGLYVFMDDKKSDYTYGERSIYKIEKGGAKNTNDPFCVKRDPETGQSIWNEDDGIRIWDNDKVLRVECLSVNSTLADFRGTIADNSRRRFDNVIRGSSDKDTSIGWEEDFELVYPEKEEIKQNKQFSPEKFVLTVQPFTDWLDWLIGTHGNQLKFLNEAAAHLDLYKMAAYYIFVLRFGLVDSLERNAQIKTYDGVHFHYEPWDMDIALGNRNTGGIAFDPPITRETMMDEDTGAISGRSRIDTNNDGISDTIVSNWLFDALEEWPYWMNTIVPKVAAEMFNQGLTYQNVIKVLDEDYQNAWCESIYNESGNFKYVVNRNNTDDDGHILPGYNDGWLSWLQGARTTHRHWWLKSSMDYYDAKWGVGEFMRKNMYIGCEMHNVNGYINVVPTSDTYFKFEREATPFGPFHATLAEPLHFDVSMINTGAKVPFHMYGANFIKEIDISDIAVGLLTFFIVNAYSSEVGPLITKVNIGVKVTLQDEDTYIGLENNKVLQITAGNALDAIEELNIRGQHSLGKNRDLHITGLDFLSNTKTIRKIYAMGAGMYTLNSAVGTDYEELELPDWITSISFNSTTWDHNKLSFWSTRSGGSVIRTYTDYATDEEGNVVYENGEPVMEEYTVEEMEPATYTKYDLNDQTIGVSIPRSLISVSFTGTTCRNACARQFIGDWIASIIKWGTEDWNNQENGADEYQSLDEYLTHLFNERQLVAENIYWDNSIIPGLSYEQLSYIAKFNNIDYTLSFTTHPNVRNFSNGYVMLTDARNLSGIETSYLATWFGDGVFILGSSGLKIDQQRDYTTISVGPSAYVDYDRDENGDLILDNNDQPITIIWLNEGESARILATKFYLRQNLGYTEFSLSAPDSNLRYLSYEYPNGSGNIAAAIVSKTIGSDTIYNLVTYPNVTGHDYYVKLNSGNGNVLIHVKALDYPELMFLSVQGDKKQLDSGTPTSFYKYNKAFDKFVLGSQTGTFLVGVLFYDKGRWVNNPIDKSLEPNYAKFKIYKDGVLCSKFENASKDYTDFTINEPTRQEFVDSLDTTLCYTVGYNPTSDMYKYYIPLCIQGLAGTTPRKYTIKCEIKIGGMITTLSQDIVVLTDDRIVAPEGTPLWGLINNSYVQQFGTNYSDHFYRSITDFITGDISVNGQYNNNGTWTTVGNSLENMLYNGHSILEYLPNITGIILDGSTFGSKTENITNINLSNITKLRTFSIQNCTGLTEDIDLTMCPNLLTVDASGTNINVSIPANSGITTYELGFPTEVSIVRPTDLVPANISVDGYKNITDLNIIKSNSLTCNGYNIFGKIMQNYFGKVYYNKLYDWHHSLYNTNTPAMRDLSGYIATGAIYVGNHLKITITKNVVGEITVKWYRQDGSFRYDTTPQDTTINQDYTANLIGGDVVYITIHGSMTNIGSFLKVEDYNTNELLFEWRK